MITLGVCSADSGTEETARALADKLGLPLLPGNILPAAVEEPQVLLFTATTGLFLQQTGPNAPGPVKVEFGSGSMRHRRKSGANELLGRAVGVGKKPQLRVLDATAGLGRDSFVLADLGCKVWMCERHPLVLELLASGIAQARDSGEDWLVRVAERLVLQRGDARQTDPARAQSIDVIYLDPMFPGRRKTASVKKEMALFQALLDADDPGTDAEDLLLWSLEQRVARVVVKRPVKAASLGERKPSHVIAGKSIRYDVYVIHALV